MHRRRDRVAPRCHPIRRRADRGRACSCGGRPRHCARARRAPAVSVALGRGEPPHRRPTWPGRAVEPAANLRAVSGAGRAPPRGEHLALRRRAAPLIANPKFLLSDELSPGPAPIVVPQTYARLPSIVAEGSSLVIVEQDVVQALKAANHVYCLQEGRVALAGAAATLTREAI